MKKFTNEIVWFYTEALEAPNPLFTGLEVSSPESMNQLVAISFKTGWPCCGFISTGGPGLIIINALTGVRLLASQVCVYFCQINHMMFDSNSENILVSGTSRANGWGVKTIQDPKSNGYVTNAFLTKFQLRDGGKKWNQLWIIQSMDTDLVGETEYFIPRTTTSLKTVEINNQNLTLLSGSFQKTLKTTWEDISGKQFEIEKKDYDTEMGNYLLFVDTTGNIVKSLATRISSFVVSRKESIVVCGKNSQFECEEISLKRNMETINKLSSNFLDYCNTSVIYSVVGDEEEIYAADQCDIPICFGESSISSSVCSGQGKCVGPNKCECFKGFSGNVCSVDDELLKKIVIPISVIIFILVVLLGIGLLIYIYRNSQWNKRKRVEAELERKLLDFELQLESNMVNSNSSYIIPMEELELIKKIGEGGFGSVYLAKWKQTTVAVKCVHVNSNLEEEEEDTFEKEVMLLNKNPFLNSQSQKIHKFSPPEITDINNFSIPLRVVKGFRPKIPFRNKTEQEQWTKEFLDSENIKETIQLTDQYFELMIKCWDGNSSNRPSFDEISDYLSKMLFWN
ncbi:hypothetical protein ABK040_003229 [Willaertia magna]